MAKEWILHVMPDAVVFVDAKTYQVGKEVTGIKIDKNFERAMKACIITTTMEGDTVKAVVISILASTRCAAELKTGLDVYLRRKTIYRFFKDQGIFCYFTTFFYMDVMSAVKSCPDSKNVGIGENILILNLFYPPFNGIIVTKERDCFKVTICLGFGPNRQISSKWMEDVVKEYNPKKVIVQYIPVVMGQPMEDFVRNVVEELKDYNLYVNRIEDTAAHLSRSAVDKVLHFMGNKKDECTLAIPPTGTFELTDGFESLIKTSKVADTPFEKCLVLENYSDKTLTLNYMGFDETQFERMKSISLASFKTKKIKILFKLDYNSFYDLKVEPIHDVEYAEKDKDSEPVAEETVEKSACGLAGLSIAPAAAPTPSVAAAAAPAAVVDAAVEKEPEMFKMVFGKQEFSVFLISENGGEKVLPDENGCEKIPIYIAFNEEKPVIGQKAKQVFEEAPKMVVFDLIKLCSIDSAEIENPKWGFSVCKEEGKIVIDMETINGKRRSHNFFLLAMVLRKGRQIVKKELGKNLDKIQIEFDGFEANEILKKNFLEAAALLNNVNLVFV